MRTNCLRGMTSFAMAAIGAVALCGEATAGLHSTGPYVGGLIGGAFYEADGIVDDIQIAVGEDAGIGVDEESFLWGFVGGWRFNDYLALEGGYVDLGQLDASIDLAESASREPTTEPTGGNGDIEVGGWLLSARASYPIYDDWLYLTGNAGAYFYELDATFSENPVEAEARGVIQDVDLHDDGVAIVAGVGLEAEVVHELALRVDYQAYVGVDGVDVHTLAIGFVMGFGSIVGL